MTSDPCRDDETESPLVGVGVGADVDRGECLVILLGQTRASGATAESFDRFLVTPLALGGRVDIALCRCSGYGEDDGYFASRASYVWEIPEPGSWNPLFDEVAANVGSQRSADWRTLIDITGNWLGEIDEADGKRPGSAARCLYLRHHALAMIRSLDLERRYRWFILTRSDYLYLFEHPPLRLLDPRRAWIPRGEDFEGITDRHVVFSAAALHRVLGVLADLLEAPADYRRLMRYHGWNLEMFLKLAFIRNGLYRDTRRFPRVMYLVRLAETDTSWASGHFDADLNVFVKYPPEKAQAKADVATLRRSGGWRSGSLRQTLAEATDRLVCGVGPQVYSGLQFCRSRLEHSSVRLSSAAAVLGGCGVTVALAGVCGVREALVSERQRHWWDASVQNLLVHGAVVLCISAAMYASTSGMFCRRLAQVGIVLLLGASLFSVGLSGAALTGSAGLRAVGVFGGIVLIAGWGLLAVIARRMWSRY